MSPTVFRSGPYRFLFFSREEPRVHIHVVCADGEAKVWMEPEIKLARSVGLSSKDEKRIVELIREHEQEIHDGWNDHFGG